MKRIKVHDSPFACNSKRQLILFWIRRTNCFESNLHENKNLAPRISGQSTFSCLRHPDIEWETSNIFVQ
jgi:hypothetical protein